MEDIRVIVHIKENAMASMSYVLTGGTGEYTEKKSRFIGELRPVESQDEAAAFLQETRKVHHDARHHCMAWIIGENGQTKHSSDDGEPSGTAGRPILSVLEGASLTNAALIVTRYFGGTLLGTGGLVRSYTAAAQATLSDAEIVSPRPALCGRLTVSYSQWQIVQALFKKQGVFVTGADYGADVTVSICAYIEQEPLLLSGLESVLKTAAPVRDRRLCQMAESNETLLLFNDEGLQRFPVTSL